jgi:hypothetical protein
VLNYLTPHTTKMLANNKSGFETHPIRKLRQLIANINRINLDKVSIDQLKNQLKILMRGHSRSGLTYPPNTLVYRGTAFATQSEKPVNVARISTAPVDLSTNYQRANRPYEPRFYAAITPGALPFELQLKSGAFIAIGTWQVLTKMSVLPIGYSTETFAKLASWRNPPFWLTSDADSAQNLLQKFFNEKFTVKIFPGEESRYKLSAAIAELLFSAKDADDLDGETLAGLQYPSIAMYADDDNLVLLPDFVNRSMKLVHVEYFQVMGQHRERDFGILPLDFADSFGPQGEIEWKGHLDYEQWHSGQSIMNGEEARKLGLLWDEETKTATNNEGVLIGMAPMRPRSFSAR